MVLFGDKLIAEKISSNLKTKNLKENFMASREEILAKLKIAKEQDENNRLLVIIYRRTKIKICGFVQKIYDDHILVKEFTSHQNATVFIDNIVDVEEVKFIPIEI